ncbi:hypothetical protein NA78x_002899 [Anatilimnocola sp. NA78]|uniref:hypothetical protein n=1 Tax=Anatilimnocola sp. NA78 TaxID=3415683 RepID=UPI003CE59399
MNNWFEELRHLRPADSGSRRNSLRHTYGTVAIADEGMEGSFKRPMRSMSYTWLPNAALQGELANDFSITHHALVLPNRGRTIHSCEPEIFAAKANAVGQIVLQRELDGRCKHGLNPLPIQLVRCRAACTHAAIYRRFACRSDLHVKQRGSQVIGADSVLPYDLGLDSKGDGEPWSINTLIEEGRARAKAVGRANCPTSTAISFGLMAAAERNPLAISPSEANLVVRRALFEVLTPPKDWHESMLDLVVERFIAAIERRASMSQSKFDASMCGGNSNLTKSLMGKAGTKGGVLSKEIVLFAWQELTWLSYCLSAVAIDWYSAAFLHSLEEPLKKSDLVRFNQLHRSQPYFGYLPLSLVWQRMELLQPIVTRIWAEPANQSLWHVLWRMLHYFAEMVENRRVADRAFK